MKKIFGLFTASGIAVYFFLLAAPVTVSSCKKEIVHDTVRIKDTLYITDSTCDLNAGLVAWYNFNGGSLKDSSGNGNHIVSNTTAVAVADRNGKANNAYLFNGTSSIMKVNNSASLNPQGKISLFAIVKLNGFYAGTCHGNSILFKAFQDENNGVYSLRVTPFPNDCNAPVDITKEKFHGNYGNGQTNTAYAVDNTTTTTGNWYYVCYTFDGVQSKLYVNGVLKNTTVVASAFTPNSEALYIGGTANPPYPFWFNGVIDDIRIYNRDLCECEVKALGKLKN